MKNLDLSKLENVERNPENYKKYGNLYLRYGSEMFRMDVLYSSGCVYKLPVIPYAGEFTTDCYLVYNEDDEQVTIYHMNGYIQPVFKMDLYGNINYIFMSSKPREYIESVRRFIFNEIMD